MTRFGRALVTGASGGLGAALARELAARGSDLVLVARREAELRRVADELAGRYGVRAEVLVADVTDAADLDRVAAAAGAVDLLVNNAGIATGGPLARLPAAGEERVVRTNVLAVVRLTAAALPGMLERGHGGVLSVASAAAFQPVPFNATYAASKAFVLSFTEAVAAEVAGRGVVATALCPGYTSTEMVGPLRLPRLLLLDPDRVARAGLDAVERGRRRCVPGWPYAALATAVRLLPPSWLGAATARVVVGRRRRGG